MKNPLLSDWNTPFNTPPFSAISVSHYKPAIEKAVADGLKQIGSIISDPSAPLFSNTIVPLEQSGEKVDRIAHILFNLNNAETCAELQNAAREIAPLLSRYANEITLNEVLFKRVEEVYRNTDRNLLTEEEAMLLEKTYLGFIHGGAALDGEKRLRFKEITEELSVITLKFEENVLNETNNYILHITSHSDLSGLPDNVVKMAESEALGRKLEGWVFTLRFPSYMPFMQYADNRNLREKMFRAYASRSFSGNENDNTSLIKRIISLRIELAQLLGYKCYADMILTDRMADSTEKVNTFLNDLHKASRKAAENDYETVMAFASETGFKGKLERWDWAYYSEKLKMQKFNIDDEILRPYFRLEDALQAVFNLASKLFGITFKPNTEVPVYHKDVEVWEVTDSDGSFISLLYLDFHPREGKSGGAWMTSFRDQKLKDGVDLRPLISIVANFTEPIGNQPSLLTFNELTTLLHEFGHALHGMLSKCTFSSLSGTSVSRDFVELPSQFMENYAYEKEWLSSWAKHYSTGESLPFEIIEKIKESSTFNEGYACNRQLGFGFLDMSWHTLSSLTADEIAEFEKKAIRSTELFPDVEGTCISTSFTHIFGGGYAAGYYGYKWAEVLDADAFSFIKEKSIFDPVRAISFRTNILEKGGSAKPMELYKRFRGQEPSIDPFLIRSGLK